MVNQAYALNRTNKIGTSRPLARRSYRTH